MSDCPRCQLRGKPEYFASDPICAFREGYFGRHRNWHCATGDALLDILQRFHSKPDYRSGIFAFREEIGRETGGILHVADIGWLFLSQNDRREIQCMWNQRGNPLGLSVAEEFIAYAKTHGWEDPLEVPQSA